MEKKNYSFTLCWEKDCKNKFFLDKISVKKIVILIRMKRDTLMNQSWDVNQESRFRLYVGQILTIHSSKKKRFLLNQKLQRNASIFATFLKHEKTIKNVVLYARFFLTWVFLFLKYIRFWSVSLELIIKHKPLISDGWLGSTQWAKCSKYHWIICLIFPLFM